MPNEFTIDPMVRHRAALLAARDQVTTAVAAARDLVIAMHDHARGLSGASALAWRCAADRLAVDRVEARALTSDDWLEPRVLLAVARVLDERMRGLQERMRTHASPDQ